MKHTPDDRPVHFDLFAKRVKNPGTWMIFAVFAAVLFLPVLTHDRIAFYLVSLALFGLTPPKIGLSTPDNG